MASGRPQKDWVSVLRELTACVFKTRKVVREVFTTDMKFGTTTDS